MPELQLFGLAKSQATRKAQRWFAERRVPVAYHDLRKRAPAAGELRRWVQRFGVEAVVDKTAKSYLDSGLAYLKTTEDAWLDRLATDPTLLRLPLARCGKDLAVGDDPEGWQRLADTSKT